MSVRTYFDVIHVGIFELFFKVGVFLEVLNDFPEVAVVVQSSFLKHKPKQTSVFVIRYIYIANERWHLTPLVCFEQIL